MLNILNELHSSVPTYLPTYCYWLLGNTDKQKQPTETRQSRTTHCFPPKCEPIPQKHR